MFFSIPYFSLIARQVFSRFQNGAVFTICITLMQVVAMANDQHPSQARLLHQDTKALNVNVWASFLKLHKTCSFK